MSPSTVQTISSYAANGMLTDHYLGSVNPARVLKAYADEEAVAVYGRPTRGNTHLGLASIELMRLWSPDVYSYTLSAFLSKTLKLLKLHAPSIQIVVAYAASEVGHHGGIYRASNWFYWGRAKAGGPQALIINGEKVHARTVNHRYGHANQQRLRQEGHIVESIARIPKHTYYYPLTRLARKTLLYEVNIARRKE